MCQVGAKARAVVEEAKGVDEEEDTGKFKQVPITTFEQGLLFLTIPTLEKHTPLTWKDTVKFEQVRL